MTNGCLHSEWRAEVKVNHIADVDRYMVDVRVFCVHCNRNLRFLGLPAGVDMNLAAVSADGLEVCLAAVPEGDPVRALGADLRGFTMATLVKPHPPSVDGGTA